MKDNPPEGWRLLTGGVLLAAAVLSALQTFFRFSEEAGKSVVAARRNSDLRRQLEHMHLKYVGGNGELRKEALAELEALLGTFTEVAEQSPTIPDELYVRAVKEFEAGDGAA